MKRITAYKTADSCAHETRDAAYRHADKAYGAVLTQHAHALAKLDGKYQAFITYLDGHAAGLADLAFLKIDRDNLETDE